MDLMMFFTFILNFDEDEFADFVLSYFYKYCYEKLEIFYETPYLAEVKTKARYIIGNLRDVMKYPKFSSGHLSSICLQDIDSYLFRITSDYQKSEFLIHVYSKATIKIVKLEFEAHQTVQHMVSELRKILEKECTEKVLQQYGLFLSFDDISSDISLSFDVQ